MNNLPAVSGQLFRICRQGKVQNSLLLSNRRHVIIPVGNLKGRFCSEGKTRGLTVKFLRRFLIRLSNFAAQRSAGQRLQEEIAEHLAFQTEENVRAGMPPAEARRQAALKLGPAEAIRERHHAEQ